MAWQTYSANLLHTTSETQEIDYEVRPVTWSPLPGLVVTQAVLIATTTKVVTQAGYGFEPSTVNYTDYSHTKTPGSFRLTYGTAYIDIPYLSEEAQVTYSKSRQEAGAFDVTRTETIITRTATDERGVI